MTVISSEIRALEVDRPLRRSTWIVAYGWIALEGRDLAIRFDPAQGGRWLISRQTVAEPYGTQLVGFSTNADGYQYARDLADILDLAEVVVIA